MNSPRNCWNGFDRIQEDRGSNFRNCLADGSVAAVSCYVYWGLIVVYWTWLDKVESEELLMHRVVWTLLIVSFDGYSWRSKDYWQGLTIGRVFRAPYLERLCLP